MKSILQILVSFLMMFTFAVTSIQAQSVLQSERKNGLSIGFFSFLTESMEINRNYQDRSKADFTSKPIVGFEGNIKYARRIGKNFEIGLGIIAGVYPMDYKIFFDSSFFQTGRSYISHSLNRRTAIYAGLIFNINYIQEINEKHFLSFGAGADYVFFIPQFYNYRISIHTGSQVINVFSSKANLNVPEKAFLAPELSLGYHRKIGQRFTPYILLKGVYSKNRPVTGREFSIFGKNETLEGTFKKQFIHAGVELGVKFSL